MNEFITEALLDLTKSCFEFMQEPLTNFEVFNRKLAERIMVKEGGNEQFDFDVELDNLVKELLEKHGITGWVFSEESKVFEIPGENRYRVVYDPFCNSSLAARSFREGEFLYSTMTTNFWYLRYWISKPDWWRWCRMVGGLSFTKYKRAGSC